MRSYLHFLLLVRISHVRIPTSVSHVHHVAGSTLSVSEYINVMYIQAISNHVSSKLFESTLCLERPDEALVVLDSGDTSRSGEVENEHDDNE